MHFPILLLGLEHIGIHILFLKDSWHADFLFIQRCFLRWVFSHSILRFIHSFWAQLFLFGKKALYLFLKKRDYSGFSFDLEDYHIQQICAEQSFAPYPEEKIPNIQEDHLSLLLSKCKIDYFWNFNRYINSLTILHKDF